MGSRPRYTDDQVARLCDEIAQGATVAEACRQAGLSYQAITKAVRRGATATRGTARELRAKVLEAQAVWEKKTRVMLLRAAAKGAPRAIEEILRRSERVALEVRPPDDAPPDNDREAWLRWRLAKVRAWISEETGIAKTKLLTVERDLMTELEKYAAERPPTPEELLEELRADLPAWSDLELLAVHAEGLDRGIPGFVERPA